MNTIDKRVVGMEFDNRQFESGVKTSLTSIENLKKSLDFGSLADGIQQISDKFSVLGIAGITAIQNIANRAVDAGMRIASSLTIAPVMEGFNEYETKMGSIQTILTNTASKGTTLEDVTNTLNELNTYADKTIYNFSEMARNIGTFTAAGVDLETSATAIQGIANLAAASGSNSQQASTAMYQLSQALAAGSVKLMDWNSVVNAGMGGELFKNALKSTAEEMGTDVDALIKKNGSFRESLQEGWITADVLNTTLKKLTKEGAKEYGESMLASGKYTQEQVDALMKQATLAEDAATQVKTFTQLFSTMKESVQSGWAVSWEYIIGDKDQATKTLTAVNDAFSALMGPMEQARNEMLLFWNQNGGRDAIIKGISNSFQALKDIIGPITEAFKEIFLPLTGTDAGKNLVEFSKDFAALTEKFKIGDETAANIKSTFKGLFSVLSIGVEIIKTVINAIGILFGATIPIGGGFLSITASIGNFLTGLNDSIKTAGLFNSILEQLKETLKPLPDSFSVFDKISSVFNKISSSVGTGIDFITSKLKNLFGGVDFEKTFGVINGGLLTMFILGLNKFVKVVEKVVSTGGGFTEILESVKKTLSAYQEQLKAGALLKIASAVGILAASLCVLSFIDPVKLASALGAITVLFGELIGSMTLLGGYVTAPGFKKTLAIIPMLIAMSTAILILSFAMRNLANLKWSGVIKGLVAITGLTVIIASFTKTMSSSEGAMLKGAVGLVLFAGAIAILTAALIKVSKLKVKDLAKGLIAIGLICAELAIFIKITSEYSMSVKSAASLLLISAAISLLATTVKKLSNINPLALAQGLSALLIILGELLLFINFAGEPTKFAATAGGLLIMAIAINILSLAIGTLGNMSIKKLTKGLGALAGALLLMGVAMHFMAGALPGAASLLIMATAIAILTPALAILGSLSIAKILKSLLAMAGLFVVLGVAATLLAPLVPVILLLSGALLLFGVACAAVGGGILLLSTGLSGLAISGAAGVAAMVAIVSSMLGLIPFAFQKVGEGLIEIATVIGEGAPAIIGALFKLFDEAIDALVERIPIIANDFLNVVGQILDLVNSNIPTIMYKVTAIILSILDGIEKELPVITNKLFEMLITLINSLAEAIRGNTEPLIEAVKNLVSALIEAALATFDSMFTSFHSVGEDFIDGITGGMNSKEGGLLSAAKTLGEKALGALKKAFDINSPSKETFKLGEQVVNGLYNGLNNFSGNLTLTPMVKPVFDMGSGVQFGSSLNLKNYSNKVQGAPYASDQKNNGNITTQEFNVSVTGNTIANDYDVNTIVDKITAGLARSQRRNQ